MDCARCGSKNYVKAGFNSGKQRYKCKKCGYFYSTKTRAKYPPEIKECALRMVADGMCFRQVERALGVSNVTVMKWVRSFGESLIRKSNNSLKNKEYDIVEIDELWAFIHQKKESNGCGYALIAIPNTSSDGGLGVVIKKC